MDSQETTPKMGTSVEKTSTQTEQPTTVEINGEQIDLEELKKGYLRQSDYTKKTQELAEQRRTIEETKAPVSEDDKAVDEYLKSKGYITKEDLEREKAAIINEQQMTRFFDLHPDLKSKEAAIRAIAKTDNSALEDIVVKYNITTSDKLQKAKSSKQIVGDISKEAPKEKSIKDMTSEEYAEYKAKNWLDKPRWSFAD